MMFLLIRLIAIGLNFYVLFRLWHMIPAVYGARIIFLVLGLIAVASFFLFFVAGNTFPFWLTTAIYRIGTTWAFIMLYLLMVFFLADILRLFGLRQVNELIHSNWKGFIALAGIMILIFTAGYINYNNKKRTVLNLDASLYTGLSESIRIVGISDLHVGYGIGANELARWVDKINAEKPDIVVIAGDLIDNGVRPLYHNNIAEVLNRIETKYGVYMALGNHEYYTGKKETLEFLSNTNIKLLEDSVILLPNGLYIAGRDDRTNPNRKALDKFLSGLDSVYPILLLDHQPYELEKAEENGVFFQFSGHTHRGQVWPISWITDRMYEDSYGYVKKGNTNYYVSSGLGIWGGKFRIGSRSEYVVIDIKN